MSKLLFVCKLNIAFRKFNYMFLTPCKAVIPASEPESRVGRARSKLGCRIGSGITGTFLAALVFSGCASNEQLFARYDALCHQGVCVAAKPTEVFYTSGVSLVWEPAVYFGYDLDELQDSEIARLDSNLAFLNRYSDLKISLQGFTDTNASKKYNLRLSDRRVRHVRDYLLQKGIADERILASRAGESLPIKPGNSIEDQIINRRVEMMLLDASGRPLIVGVNPEVADPNSFVAPTPDRKVKE